MLFRETVFFSENLTKHINIVWVKCMDSKQAAHILTAVHKNLPSLYFSTDENIYRAFFCVSLHGFVTVNSFEVKSHHAYTYRIPM